NQVRRRILRPGRGETEEAKSQHRSHAVIIQCCDALENQFSREFTRSGEIHGSHEVISIGDNIRAMSITDISPEAQAVQLRVQRAMSGEQRLLLALEMSLFARELAKARIQQEHPEWNESDVTHELLRLAFL